MHTQHLYKRTTFKYVDAYRSLDASHYIGSVKLTPQRMVREGNFYDDGGTYVRLAKLPAGLSAQQRKEWREVLAENLSKHGCGHEYDCCGCQSQSTRVHATRNARTALVVTSVGYNY